MRSFLLLATTLALFSAPLAAQVSCPSPPGSAAAFACAVCDFSSFTAATGGQLPSNPGGDWCGGVINNDQYFGFVAGAANVELDVSVTSCSSGSGIQLALFDINGEVIGTCISESVNPGQTETLTADGLTVGDYYMLGIDGFAGALCDFQVSPNTGFTVPPPDVPGPISGPTSACWDTTLTYTLDSIPNATGYFWEVRTGPFTDGTQVFPAEAFNLFTGTSTPELNVRLPELPATMPLQACDTIHIDVFPINACFLSNQTDSSTVRLVVCNDGVDTVRRAVCFGDSLEFPAGSSVFYGPDDYYNFNLISSSNPATGSCATQVLIVEPSLKIDTLGTVRDTAFCLLRNAVGFTEPVVAEGLYYLELPNSAGCGTVQAYNVTLLSTVIQQIPTHFCNDRPISELFIPLPPPLKGSLFKLDRTPIDTSALPLGGLASGMYRFSVSGLGCPQAVGITVNGNLTFQIDTIKGIFKGLVLGSADTIGWSVDGILRDNTDSFTFVTATRDTVLVEATAWNACDTIRSAMLVYDSTPSTQSGCPYPPGVAGAQACLNCDFVEFCGTTGRQLPSTPGGDWCGGVIDNDQYFGFLAGTTGSVEFEVTADACLSGSGLQFALFDADGNVVGTCISDNVPPGSTETLVADSLVPGQIYLLGVDGFAGSICTFTVTPVSGLQTSGPTSIGPIKGPSKACWETVNSYSLDPIGGATGYYWTATLGTYTFGATLTPPEAFNPSIGVAGPTITIELPEAPQLMPANTCDTIRLEVFPINTCFAPAPNLRSTFELAVCRNTIDTVRRNVCFGDLLEYPPASGNFFGPSEYFTFNPVSMGVGPPDGCEQFEVLLVIPTPLLVDTTIRDTTICFPSLATGFFSTVDMSGLYPFTLSNPDTCDIQVIYNITLGDLDTLLQYLPPVLCGTASADNLDFSLPSGIQASLLAPDGSIVDTASLPPTGLPGGLYEVEVTTPDCVVKVPLDVIGGLAFQSDTLNGTFIGTLLGRADSITWTVNGIVQSTADSFTITATLGDTLRVAGTAWNACDTARTSILVFGPQSSSLSEAALVDELRVWPNPTYGLLRWSGTFASNITPLSLSVYDGVGRRIETHFLPPVQRQEASLQLGHYAAGSYRLVWTTSAGVLSRTVNVR